jgi:Zn-dependent peptidase ImmA (M78 family)
MKRGFKSKCENTSLQIRRELKLRRTDPLPIELLATHIEVKLLKPSDILGLSNEAINILLGSEKDSWSAVTISSGGTDIVIYNPTHSTARRSTDIMHELAHMILRHKHTPILLFSQSDKVILRSYDEDQENEADWLAGCLLLPREALLHMTRIKTSKSDVCTEYAVSAQLLKYRTDITGVRYQIKPA